VAGTPQRFTPRAGSNLPGRVRRSLDGGVESAKRFDGSVDIKKDGRLGVNIARNSGLEMTRDGLRISPQALGEKNRPQLDSIRDLSSSASGSQLIDKVNELLFELRRTGSMRR
jgi:hypothetical protein